uniref:Uncharacterized protein n=1 Tax=Anguilla anguilla TaxID=7936 RepID=A0A0E9VD33_ANGAN
MSVQRSYIRVQISPVTGSHTPATVQLYMCNASTVCHSRTLQRGNARFERLTV